MQKAFIVDFGSRDGANYTWQSHLQAKTTLNISHVCVAALPRADSNAVLAIAPHLTAQAIERVGGQLYYDRLNRQYEAFLHDAPGIGISLKIQHGLEALKNDYDRILSGDFDSSVGLIYDLS